jgi:hypothetical protein
VCRCEFEDDLSRCEVEVSSAVSCVGTTTQIVFSNCRYLTEHDSDIYLDDLQEEFELQDPSHHCGGIWNQMNRNGLRC